MTEPLPELNNFLDHLFEIELPYPWEPGDPDNQLYFESLDEDSVFYLLTDELVSDRNTAFLNQLELLLDCPLWQSLQTQFGKWVPQQALQEIFQRIQSTPKIIENWAETLLNLSQSLLPQWSADDLQVFVRPYAFAMRHEASSCLILPDKNWSELSAVEQAKWTVAIANYALEQQQQV